MQRHTVTTNGLALNVFELGTGPAVLFCHGFPAIAASWRQQMQTVAEAGYRAIAPDMRGYGGSDAPDEAEAYMAFHTDGDLVGILDHFRPCQPRDRRTRFWCQHRLERGDDAARPVSGGVRDERRVPPPWGPSFPDRLREAGRDDFYMFAQMRPEADALWADAATTIPASYYRLSGEAPTAERGRLLDRDSMLRPTGASPGSIDPDYLAEAVAAFSKTGFHGPLNYYRALDPFFAIASAAYAGATVAKPAWFLTGSDDVLRSFHPDEATMREAVTDLRGYTVLDGVGHWPQLEAPDLVNRSLLAFLAEVS